MINHVAKIFVTKKCYGNRDMNVSSEKNLRKFYGALTANDTIGSPTAIHTAPVGLLGIIRRGDSKVVKLPLLLLLLFCSVFTCDTKQKKIWHNSHETGKD